MSNKRKKALYSLLAVAGLILAGFVVQGAAANAAGGLGRHVVEQKNVAPEAVSWSKIKPGAVNETRLSGAVKEKLNTVGTGEPGPQGEPGPKGDPGEKGEKGDPGLSGLHADAPYGADLPGQDSSDTALAAGQTTVVWTACAEGESAVGGGYRVGDLANESFGTSPSASYPDLQVLASEPAYYMDGGLVNGAEAAPVNDNLSFRPNAWAVTVHNAGESDSVARAWAACAKVAE